MFLQNWDQFYNLSKVVKISHWESEWKIWIKLYWITENSGRLYLTDDEYNYFLVLMEKKW